jgi:hypothetical protein
MDKKRAIHDFKERKVARGVYAVRCNQTGDVWVGSSPNLAATRNGTWFCLQNGSSIHKQLQAEWDTRGEAAFEYEIIEQLEDDVSALALRDVLKEKKQEWVTRLGAQALL